MSAKSHAGFFSGPDIALLTARRRNGRELDENRARWSAALASHSGRDATHRLIRCEGKLAFRVSTLPAWCTGRRRFHCSRRPRRFAQQDKSGAWIRSGHRDGGSAVAPTPLCSIFVFALSARRTRFRHRQYRGRATPFDSDDYIEVTLDTFQDQRHAFVFDVNPRGVQADALLTEVSSRITPGTRCGTRARRLPHKDL